MKRNTLTLTAVTLLSIVLLAACSTSGNTPVKTGSSQSATAETSTSTSSQQETFKVGDTITFKDEAEYVITGVEFTDERNEFADIPADKVLKVTYNVKNLSQEDLSVGMDLELYVGGKKMESYPNDNTIDTLSAGRSYENATAHFAVVGDGEMELEIEPLASFDSKPAIVKIQP